MTHDSIRELMTKLEERDSQAQREIWSMYVAKVLRLARNRLANLPKREFDEHDVVQSAFASFFRGVEAGRFQQMADELEIWKLLVCITHRKVNRVRRMRFAKRRGEGQVTGESGFGPIDDEMRAIENVCRDEPDPEMALELEETLQSLLQALADATLEKVILLRLEGFSVEEIAEQVGVSSRTVKRKLALAREVWIQAGDSDR